MSSGFVTIAAGAALLASGILPSVAQAGGSDVTVYFTRHAEKMTEQMELEQGKYMDICKPDFSRCAELLNPKGELRAELLADYFDDKGITDKLTHVFSSDKQRTRQTVEEIAARAGLDNDDDLVADGVQQLPAYVDDELSSNSPSVQPTVDALLSLPAGSVALVGAHSGTIYRIFGGEATDGSGGLGIDTTQDPLAFPKKTSDLKVPDFGDLWTVRIKNGQGELKKRIMLQPDELNKQ